MEYMLPRLGIVLASAVLAGCPNDTTPVDTDGSETSTDPTSTDPTSTSTSTESSSGIDPDTSGPDPATSGESSSAPESSSSESSADDSSSSSSDASSSESSSTTGEPACGDDVIDPGEDCDGEDLGGADCMSEDFVGGVLACADDCTFDVSACTSAQCGNDVREGDEACDGDDLGGQSCDSLGEGDGTLACADDCTFDIATCDADCQLGATEIEFESLGDFVSQGDAWQSFTADTTGEIVQVDLYWNVGGTNDEFLINVYAGEGNGGPLLHSEVFPGQGVGNWVGFDTNVLSASIPIVAGSVYTIEGVETFGWQTANGAIAGASSSVGANLHKNIRVSVAPCIAECNLGDQEVEFESLGDYVGHGDAWQSFTADTTGEIVQVDLFWNVGGVNDSFTMNLYAGEGTGGALLHSEVFPGQGMGNWVGFDTNVLSTSIPIEAGSVYTVQGLDTFGWQTASGAIPGASSNIGANQHKNIRVSVLPCE